MLPHFLYHPPIRSVLKRIFKNFFLPHLHHRADNLSLLDHVVVDQLDGKGQTQLVGKRGQGREGARGQDDGSEVEFLQLSKAHSGVEAPEAQFSLNLPPLLLGVVSFLVVETHVVVFQFVPVHGKVLKVMGVNAHDPLEGVMPVLQEESCVLVLRDSDHICKGLLEHLAPVCPVALAHPIHGWRGRLEALLEGVLIADLNGVRVFESKNALVLKFGALFNEFEHLLAVEGYNFLLQATKLVDRGLVEVKVLNELSKLFCHGNESFDVVGV